MKFDLEVCRGPADVDWDEVAAFLVRGFDRPMRAEGLAWEFARPSVLVLARSGSGGLVGSQGFLAMDLWEGTRQICSAKSERTLVDKSARGSALFAEMYRAAMRSAYEDLGAECLWGLTAIPDPFMKMGYWCHSGIYTHTLLPTGRVLGRAIRATRRAKSVSELTRSIRPTDEEAVRLSTHPDYRMLQGHLGNGRTLTLSAVGGQARLRLVDLAEDTDVEDVVSVALGLSREDGCRTLRLSYNRRAPFGSGLDAWLRQFPPYPRRAGGGHFIVRPGPDADLRLFGRASAWDLHGWEDVIHDPA